MSLNRVILIGNLGADPDIRRTQSGMAILSLRIAVNDRRKNPQTGEWSDHTNWVNVVMFGSRAEALANMLHKGSKIGVDGKLRYSEWEDRSGNGKRSKLEVMADDIELLTPKGQGQQQGGRQQAASQTPTVQQADATVYDDDIPF